MKSRKLYSHQAGTHCFWMFLPGGAGHGGVGSCISRQFCCQVGELTFHAFRVRLRSLKFAFMNKKCVVFACYFPTTGMPDETIFEMYGLLDLLLRTCVREGRAPVPGMLLGRPAQTGAIGKRTFRQRASNFAAGHWHQLLDGVRGPEPGRRRAPSSAEACA